jgi:sorbitol-specific phosphotransferase system component IIA
VEVEKMNDKIHELHHVISLDRGEQHCAFCGEVINAQDNPERKTEKEDD